MHWSIFRFFYRPEKRGKDFLCPNNGMTLFTALLVLKFQLLGLVQSFSTLYKDIFMFLTREFWFIAIRKLPVSITLPVK